MARNETYLEPVEPELRRLSSPSDTQRVERLLTLSRGRILETSTPFDISVLIAKRLRLVVSEELIRSMIGPNGYLYFHVWPGEPPSDNHVLPLLHLLYEHVHTLTELCRANGIDCPVLPSLATIRNIVKTRTPLAK